MSPQDVDAFRQATKALDAGTALAATETDGTVYPRPALRNALVEPRDELERTIAGIWQRALRIDEIGIHDSFVELGGHSLLAMQVVSLLRDELGAELKLRSVFNYPTVAALAEHLRAGIGEADAASNEEGGVSLAS